MLVRAVGTEDGAMRASGIGTGSVRAQQGIYKGSLSPNANQDQDQAKANTSVCLRVQTQTR